MTRPLSRRSALRALGVGAVSLAAGCAAPGSPFGGSSGPTVRMRNADFHPETVVADLGDTVTWWNAEEFRHTVTAYEHRIPDGADYFASGGFESESDAEWDWYGARAGDVLRDDPFTYTFETVGAYEYYCIPHRENMVGSVTVEPA